MHIGQIYIVYNEAPYIFLIEDQVQNTSGQIYHELDIKELNLYFRQFQQQLNAEQRFLNFSKGEFVLNNKPNDCILIDSSAEPPPVTPVTTKIVKITNARTNGDDGISITSWSNCFDENLIQEGNFVNVAFYKNPITPAALLTFNENSGGPLVGQYRQLSAPVRITVKALGVTLFTLVTAGTPSFTPVYLEGYNYDNFDEILIEDAAAPPPPAKTGVFQVQSNDASVTINAVTSITNAGIVYPVTNQLKAGTWSNFAGGTISIDVTSVKLLELVVFYNNVAQTERFNQPGTGIYNLTFNPNPANGTVIRIFVRSLN